MDLPTYTNIWRIEKRLYKLYDFRLPMPLPIGQVAVFAVITVPYVVTLTVLGLPFSHTLLWAYVLPPGLLTWLVTRPVLESKRLPELVTSQLRYLGEPRTWCRMAPLAEKDEITITCRVWRQVSQPAGSQRLSRPGVAAELAGTSAAAVQIASAALDHAPASPRPAAARRAAVQPAGPQPAGVRSAAAEVAGRAGPVRVPGRGPASARPAPAAGGWPAEASAATTSKAPQWPFAGAREPLGAAPAAERPAGLASGSQHPGDQRLAQPDTVAADERPPPTVRPEAQRPGPMPAAERPAAVPRQAEPAASQSDSASRPPVRVRAAAESRPARAVEHALAAPSAQRPSGWRDHVVVVPGGHRPGQPGRQQRDQARAVLPLAGQRRIVVLGCTVGAGQTVTTLLAGETLAALRSDQIAVLDLNPGPGSLADRAGRVPVVVPQRAGAPAVQPGATRLQVITRGDAADPAAEQDAGRIFELVSARYPLTFADPAAAAVPKVLAVADQLVLVAPASEEAARAIAMTYEWLEAHGHAGLAAAAVTVLNGVSAATLPHVEHAESVASGRCRAIVRVPWDDCLQDRRPERGIPRTPAAAGPARPAAGLSASALHAYTALAGVLVAGLAEPAGLSGARA